MFQVIDMQFELLKTSVERLRSSIVEGADEQPQQSTTKTAPASKRAPLSASARKRIATAQKKRWAEKRQNEAQAMKKARGGAGKNASA